MHRLRLADVLQGAQLLRAGPGAVVEDSGSLPIFRHTISSNEKDVATCRSANNADKPILPVVMLSAFDNPTYVARAVAMGASGFLSKGCTREELFNAITKAATGETVFTHDELRCIAGAMTTPRILGNIEVPLTPREAEVLRELTNGQTNEKIAKTLHFKYETIKEHVEHILSKIGVIDRTQAAVWAVRKGLF